MGNLFLVQLRSSSSVLKRGRDLSLVFWLWEVTVEQEDEDEGSSSSILPLACTGAFVAGVSLVRVLVIPSGTSVPVE